jgi:hypothetical protein
MILRLAILLLLLTGVCRAGATSAEFPWDGGYLVGVTVTNDTADRTIFAVEIQSPAIRPVEAPANWQTTFLDADTLCCWSTVVGEFPRGSDLGPGQSGVFKFSSPVWVSEFPVWIQYTDGTVDSLIDPLEVPEFASLAVLGLGALILGVRR